MPIEIRFPPPAHLADPISRVWLAESIFIFERIKHLPYGESDKCDNDRLAAVLHPFRTETLRAHPGSKNRSSTNVKGALERRLLTYCPLDAAFSSFPILSTDRFHLRQRIFFRGFYEDQMYFGLLRKEWTEATAPRQ
jgi:hypothetical protein